MEGGGGERGVAGGGFCWMGGGGVGAGDDTGGGGDVGVGGGETERGGGGGGGGGADTGGCAWVEMVHLPHLPLGSPARFLRRGFPFFLTQSQPSARHRAFLFEIVEAGSFPWCLAWIPRQRSAPTSSQEGPPSFRPLQKHLSSYLQAARSHSPQGVPGGHARCACAGPWAASATSAARANAPTPPPPRPPAPPRRVRLAIPPPAPRPRRLCGPPPKGGGWPTQPAFSSAPSIRGCKTEGGRGGGRGGGKKSYRIALVIA